MLHLCVHSTSILLHFLTYYKDMIIGDNTEHSVTNSNKWKKTPNQPDLLYSQNLLSWSEMYKNLSFSKGKPYSLQYY